MSTCEKKRASDYRYAIARAETWFWPALKIMAFDETSQTSGERKPRVKRRKRRADYPDSWTAGAQMTMSVPVHMGRRAFLIVACATARTHSLRTQRQLSQS